MTFKVRIENFILFLRLFYLTIIKNPVGEFQMGDSGVKNSKSYCLLYRENGIPFASTLKTRTNKAQILVKG